MKRSLLYVSRSCRRSLSTQAATAAEVPEDPDILTTQNPSFNKPTSNDSTSPSNNIDLSQQYPRLQYRSPALGVVPAFDLALDIIKNDRQLTKQKMHATKKKIKTLETKPDSSLKTSQLRDLKVYHRQLEGLLDINDPEIHWRHARGDIDLNMPIYRHLAQRKWQEKALRLLEQRVTQMSVTPDIIPIISPTVDVRLNFPGRTKGERKGLFEAGEMLNSRESSIAPKIEIQSFGDDSKKYSIAIVDQDVPDEANDAFKSYLHYLQTDVVLSPVEHAVDAANGKVIHSFIPPHPHKGTPYHRYTVVVWEQPEQAPQPNAPLAGKQAIPRENFDAQKFAQQNGLHAVGINFWRQVWDENVSSVMADYPEVAFVEKNFRPIKA
ncbi:Putative uncharacterized protein [Taphrina deformans PYCC 5710]|uniref:PEBP-like protein n=1 Tax=Taphrina deformans (strain PYCC 5710 / ATCC 11124 / CBS 356.35 / IMI 108563 / JCM 9778 / NBRC 8474) TaxID=1097556 RepID=R4XBX4_TAPDE|nr:Putative uncharacterized protein [Taphrina deformans PYCC 5710]|eukprot:CCG83372.1 Putative uncharacterized protein [Taphrina deformans PYCC 5710]